MKRRVSYTLLWALIVLALLPACRRPVGPRFQAAEICPPEKGLVYVYRPAASRRSAPETDWPYLFVDGEKRYSMAIGGYALLYEDPGKHVYEIKATHLNGLVAGRTLCQIDLDVETGKEYYLAFEQNFGGINTEALVALGLAAAARVDFTADVYYTSRIFSQVPKEIALPELQKTRSFK